MTEQNYEQIRAQVAMNARNKIGTGSEGGKAVAKKIPALIIQNGFLGALAFAIESVNDSKFLIGDDGYYVNKKSSGETVTYDGCGYANTFVSVLQDLKKTKKDLGICDRGLENFIKGLCEKTALELRFITDEAVAYLNYLRRFAMPE